MSQLRQIIKKIISEERQKLNEMFQSKKLAQFAKDLSTFKTWDAKGSKLFKGVAWDKIPDEEVKISAAGDDSIKQYIKDDQYAIIWLTTKKHVIKYKPTTYSRYGASRDNSIYSWPGRILVTVGKRFLYGYGEFSQWKTAEEKYDKPYDGKLSILKLSTELDAKALIIKLSVLKQYATDDLISSRQNSKYGATFLMKAAEILSDNQYRYQEILRKNKLNKNTSEIDKAVKEKLDILKQKITEASKINFDTLITYTKNSYHSNTNLETPELANIDFSTLKEYVSLYKAIVHEYDRYIGAEKNTLAGYRYDSPDDKKAFLQKLLDKV